MLLVTECGVVERGGMVGWWGGGVTDHGVSLDTI